MPSAWPKYYSGNCKWEEASRFLYDNLNGDFNRTASSCRFRVIGHLAKRFATVTDAEIHYGIDLEGVDAEDQSVLAVASLILKSKRPKAGKTKTSVHSNVEFQPATTTPTASTQTECFQSQRADFLKSQPLRFQV
ncbi:uncharacterized protein LOC134198490 [Corticium candelabrum]|uniref:uncharacterized protein LOC134198490 n=1 Tax=Corticium candelabrum TaxID=121492 RepID=UPI002E2584B2|nr:uncharacterized protein LOC134198490 [Corticium candelabrum]